MDLSLFNEKINLLSAEEQDEIMDHIDLLLSSKKEMPPYRPTFDWAGGLSSLKEGLTSVQLQKTVLH